MQCEIDKCPEWGKTYRYNCRIYSVSKSLKCKLREEILKYKDIEKMLDVAINGLDYLTSHDDQAYAFKTLLKINNILKD